MNKINAPGTDRTELVKLAFFMDSGNHLKDPTTPKTMLSSRTDGLFRGFYLIGEVLK
jgi:hypothetical protein